VFPEEDALPRPELHPTAAYRDHLAGAGQSHLDVTGHIIRPFQRVPEIRIVFRDEPIQPSLEITPSGGIGVFHDDQTATRMLTEHRNHSGRNGAGRHDFRDLCRHFNRAGAPG